MYAFPQRTTSPAPGSRAGTASRHVSPTQDALITSAPLPGPGASYRKCSASSGGGYPTPRAAPSIATATAAAHALNQRSTSEVNKVNQCTKCGALTMLARCPRCDGATVSPGFPQRSVSGGGGGGGVSSRSPSASVRQPSAAPSSSRHHQVGQAAPMGTLTPRAASTALQSPSVSIAPPVAATPVTLGGERSRSGPSMPISPAKAIPASTSAATTAGLRSDYERLQAELKNRTQELASLKAEAGSSAHTRHEVEELWQTIKVQQELIDRSALLEAELRSWQQKYEALVQERDRWRSDSLRHQEAATDAVNRSADEIDTVRAEVRTMAKKLHESELEILEWKRKAVDSDHALESQKSKVQRTTAEVKELQSAIAMAKEEDQQTMAESASRLASTERELRSLQSEHRKLELDHKQCSVKAEERVHLFNERIHVLEEQLQLQESEARASREEVIDTRRKLAESVAQISPPRERKDGSVQSSPFASPAREREQMEAQELKLQVEKLEELVKDLKHHHSLLSLELAETNGQLDAQRLQAEQVTEKEAQARDAVEIWKRKTEDALQAKERQRQQLDEVRLELLQLNKEAETAASLISLKETDTSTLESKLEGLQATVRAQKEELGQRSEELHFAKQKNSEVELALNTARSELSAERNDRAEALVRREQQLSCEHEEQLKRLRSQCDQQSKKLTTVERQLSQRDELHGEITGSLKSEIDDLQRKCETMKFECERLQANSPRRIARQMEQEQLKTKSEKHRREDAERRVEEHKVLSDSLRNEIALARGETNSSRETTLKLTRQLATIQELLRCPAAEEVVPQLHQLLSEKEKLLATLHRQETESERQILELKEEVKYLQKDREKFKTDSESHFTNWKQVAQKYERQQALHEAKLEAEVMRLTGEKDTHLNELEGLRLKHQRYTDDSRRDIDVLRRRVEEAEDTVDRQQAERESLQRQQHESAKEIDQLKRLLAESEQRLEQSHADYRSQCQLATELEMKLKEAKRQQERLEEDKTRLTTEVSTTKASTEGELTEMRQRLDDLRDKHQREQETLRATLRVERDKLLQEVEKTHQTELKVTELEMVVDALQAERERTKKEIDLVQKSQLNKSESFQLFADEATREKETLRKDLEHLRQKHTMLLQDLEVALRDKRRAEEEMDQTSRQRDVAVRQLDSAKLERDVAVKNALASSSTGTPGMNRSASGSGPMLHGSATTPVNVSGALERRTSSPPRGIGLGLATGAAGGGRSLEHSNTGTGASFNPHATERIAWAHPIPSNASTPPDPLPDPRTGTRHSKNDALFAHFREQQSSSRSASANNNMMSTGAGTAMLTTTQQVQYGYTGETAGAVGQRRETLDRTPLPVQYTPGSGIPPPPPLPEYDETPRGGGPAAASGGPLYSPSAKCTVIASTDVSTGSCIPPYRYSPPPPGAAGATPRGTGTSGGRRRSPGRTSPNNASDSLPLGSYRQ